MSRRIVNGYLIVRADGSLRTTKKKVPLHIDEVAFPLTVTIPSTWGQVQRQSIEVTLPDPPEPAVTIGEGLPGDQP